MSGIFGHLGVNDNERVFSATVGQQVIWEAAQEYLARVNAEINSVTSIFIEKTTGGFKERYKLPGGGYLQRRGADGRYGTVKAYGKWDVAFPLQDYGAQVAWNDVDMAYMTVQELSNHLQTVTIQDINTSRFELLYAILNNTQRTFGDEYQGDLLIEPLANGDTVVYPPVIGSQVEATENHYLESGYASASISDVNNPFITIVDELEQHFGTPQGGSNILVLVNNAQTAVIQSLTNFIEADQADISYGVATDRITGLPTGMPGRILGKCDGAWIAEWRSFPANYMFGIHLDVPKPLVKRVDPADTGLAEGLLLIAENEAFPFKGSFFRHRFGLGCGNRLNGVVMELGVGGTYSIPSGYS